MGKILVDLSISLDGFITGPNPRPGRGIKQRYYPMRGFGTFTSAARFCCAFDESCNYFRFRRSRGEMVSLAKQRQLFCQRLTALQALMEAVS